MCDDAIELFRLIVRELEYRSVLLLRLGLDFGGDGKSVSNARIDVMKEVSPAKDAKSSMQLMRK